MLKLQIFGPLSKEVKQTHLNFACLGLTEPPSAFLLLVQATREGFFQSTFTYHPSKAK